MVRTPVALCLGQLRLNHFHCRRAQSLSCRKYFGGGQEKSGCGSLGSGD